MKLPERRISDVENKLRVLLSVDALQMATRDQLWPFLAKLDMMEYMPMCVYVDELCRDGALIAGEHALEHVLYLSDTGREYLRLFGARMPAGDRARIAQSAPDYLRALAKQRQLSAVYELAPPGEYRALCTYREGDVPTLTMRVATREREVVRQAVECFAGAASALLTLLYTLDASAPATPCAQYPTLEAAMEAAKPNEPTLCADGKREHTAVAWLVGAQARYEVALLMPSQNAAERWAHAASEDGYAGQALAQKITRALLGGQADA